MSLTVTPKELEASHIPLRAAIASAVRASKDAIAEDLIFAEKVASFLGEDAPGVRLGDAPYMTLLHRALADSMRELPPWLLGSDGYVGTLGDMFDAEPLSSSDERDHYTKTQAYKDRLYKDKDGMFRLAYAMCLFAAAKPISVGLMTGEGTDRSFSTWNGPTSSASAYLVWDIPPWEFHHLFDETTAATLDFVYGSFCHMFETPVEAMSKIVEYLRSRDALGVPGPFPVAREAYFSRALWRTNDQLYAAVLLGLVGGYQEGNGFISSGNRRVQTILSYYFGTGVEDPTDSGETPPGYGRPAPSVVVHSTLTRVLTTIHVIRGRKDDEMSPGAVDPVEIRDVLDWAASVIDKTNPRDESPESTVYKGLVDISISDEEDPISLLQLVQRDVSKLRAVYMKVTGVRSPDPDPTIRAKTSPYPVQWVSSGTIHSRGLVGYTIRSTDTGSVRELSPGFSAGSLISHLSPRGRSLPLRPLTGLVVPTEIDRRALFAPFKKSLVPRYLIRRAFQGTVTAVERATAKFWQFLLYSGGCELPLDFPASAKGLMVSSILPFGADGPLEAVGNQHIQGRINTGIGRPDESQELYGRRDSVGTTRGPYRGSGVARGESPPQSTTFADPQIMDYVHAVLWRNAYKNGVLSGEVEDSISVVVGQIAANLTRHQQGRLMRDASLEGDTVVRKLRALTRNGDASIHLPAAVAEEIARSRDVSAAPWLGRRPAPVVLPNFRALMAAVARELVPPEPAPKRRSVWGRL